MQQICAVLFTLFFYGVVLSYNFKVDSFCIYTMKNGSVINLTSITKPGEASFNSQVDPHLTYFYNPCYDFSKGKCSDVAICQVNDTDNASYTGFGKAGRDNLNYDNLSDHYYLKYSSSPMQANVTLWCIPELRTPRLKVTEHPHVNTIDSSTTTNLSMILYTECACPDKCRVTIPEKKDLSTGSVLLIVLFTSLFLYLFGGILFMRYFRGATGYESIPHYEFWTDLPLLIRDGILFTTSGCKTDVMYDRI